LWGVLHRANSEALLRLLVADLVGEAATRDSMLTLRDDVGGPLPPRGDRSGGRRPPPIRSKYLLIVALRAPALRAAPRPRGPVERALDPADSGRPAE
jgi:hypothetical protein